MRNRRAVGQEGEALAASYLKERGMRIVDRNVRCALGEIDLVGLDGDTIVFVEVRTRSSLVKGSAKESITAGKQRRLVRLAQWYLKAKRWENRSARFDVVAVTWIGETPELDWIPNAFDAFGCR